MNLSFPDVLVSSLEQMFKDFARQVTGKNGDSASLPGSKIGRFLWSRKHRNDPALLLLTELNEVVRQLGVLKNAPDETNG